jgi:hypothetical protein
MFSLSTTLPYQPGTTAPASVDPTRGTTWIGYHAGFAPAHVLPPRHGCTVVRRITDDRGREWRVRQLWSENCHGLLFQCAVRGLRSEIRPMRGPLESLTDDELIIALAATDD